MPILSRLCRYLGRRRSHRGTSAHRGNLPALLLRFRDHPAIVLVETDPALSPALRGPFDGIRAIVVRLVSKGRLHGRRHIALYADVVVEDPAYQRIHITLAGTRPMSLRTWRRSVALAKRHGGMLFREVDDDGRRHVILEMAIAFATLDVDIDALRASLGSQEALRTLVRLLDETLARDLEALGPLLAAREATPLQAWLHRVAGVLGLAEATTLADIGQRLEDEIIVHGRSARLDEAIRQFGDDAARLLAVLRASVDPLRL
ncbi:MAG: hypothetical protein GAK28_03767 [Luteibacter sp.]|nr:MAG: hypothetical protein GAK28_03767 [Luteibacter sp.]